MRYGVQSIRSTLVPLFLLLAFASLVALARRDRTLRPHGPLSIDHRTIRMPTDPVVIRPEGSPRPQMPSTIPEAAAELEQAAAAANEARARLEVTTRDLERAKQEIVRKQEEFQAVSSEADSRQKAARAEIEAAQRQMEAKREELQTAAQEAEERVARARLDLEDLERRRLASAAQAGIARGLGHGPRLDMQVRSDPRRFRSPAFAPFAPNPAAVAAGGAASHRQSGGSGGTSGPLVNITPQGDILQAQARRIEAEGRYAVDTSTAAINAQTARAMSLDNNVRTAETFFESRRINRINRAFEAGPPITFDQTILLAAAGLPPRPMSSQLDRASGEITWPKVLQDPTYAVLTSRIQSHFFDRCARGGAFDFASAEACDATFAELIALMRGNLRRYASGEYGAARTFLDGLQREYDLPLDY